MAAQPGPGGNAKTDSTPEMNDRTKPAVMAIPKDGFFKREDGRYGPIFHELRDCGAGMGRYKKSVARGPLSEPNHTLWLSSDLVPRDTQSLFIPEFQRSEIFWFSSGPWNDFCRCARLGRDAQAPIKRRHEPKNGCNYGRISDSLGLLRLINCFATCNSLECDRSVS